MSRYRTFTPSGEVLPVVDPEHPEDLPLGDLLNDIMTRNNHEERLALLKRSLASAYTVGRKDAAAIVRKQAEVLNDDRLTKEIALSKEGVRILIDHIAKEIEDGE